MFPPLAEHKKPNKSVIGVTFNTDDTESMTEYYIHDLGTIIASIGGGLGMFLGFSFLGMALKVLCTIQDKYRVDPEFKANTHERIQVRPDQKRRR